MVKGGLTIVKVANVVRHGVVVSTGLFNESIQRMYFVPASKRSKQHDFEVEVTIKGSTYTFQPQNLMSLPTNLPITFGDKIAPEKLEEICKRIRLIMDLG